MKLNHLRLNSFNHWPLVALIIVFYLVTGLVSLLLPLDETPDEQAHFTLVRFIAENHRFPMTTQERIALGDKGDASPIYHGVVAVLSQHNDISALPKYDFLNQSGRFIPYDTIPTTQKLHTESERFPFKGIVLAWHLARFVSILLNTLTIIAIYLTGLAIFPQQRYFALAMAGFAAFIPYFIINCGVVNDDNLVIPLTTCAVYYLVRIIQGDRRRLTFGLLGALIGLAVITKYHSVVLLAETTGIFLILALQNRQAGQQWLRHWGVVLGSFFLTTAWWFTYLFICFNRIAELGLVGGLLATLGDPTTTEASLLSHPPAISWAWIAPVFKSFWIVAGSLVVFAPAGVYQLLVVVTAGAGLGLAWLAYRHLRRNARIIWRPDMILLGLHLLLYLGIVFGRYQVFMARGVEPPPYSTQGRHLYPAIIAVAFFYTFGLKGFLGVWAERFKKPAVADFNRLWPAGLIPLSLLAFSLAVFFFFVRPIYRPYLPVLAFNPNEVPISHRMNVPFAAGVTFAGYTLHPPVSANSILPVELYWQATQAQTGDYVGQLCLRDDNGEAITCQWSYPADGLYPARAWGAGNLVRDEHALPLPSACLPAGDYELTLSAWPLRNDLASAAIGGPALLPTPLSLGRVTLNQPPSAPPQATLCAAGSCRSEGEITLSQIRQSLTVISYPDRTQAGNLTIRLSAPSGATWLPFDAGRPYRCPTGQIIQTHSFLTDEAVAPEAYRLTVNNQAQETFLVRVKTRLRNFSSPPAPQTSANILFANEFLLLGYDADLSPRQPDAPIEVTTYWQTRQRMSRNYNIALHLLDNQQITQRAVDHHLGELYPNILWVPGEFTQNSHILPGDYQTPPGLYTLELRLYDYADSQFRPLPMVNAPTGAPVEHNLVVGQIKILDQDQEKSPTYGKNIRLGEEIQFLGYDLPNSHINPDKPLSLVLYWQALKPPQTNYTVFTQLIGPDGLVWGQQDNQPQQGRYPTTAWQTGEKVVDRYQITARADAPAGSYYLLVGMYDLSTGKRLPATDAQGNRLPDDAIALNEMAIQREP